VKRRTFLLLTSAGAIATITPFCNRRATPSTPSPLNTPDFLATLCDSRTIRKIGTAYRKTTTNENREDRLTGLLSAGLDQKKDTTDQLNNEIKADFAAGRILTLEGWVISLTEARQCALYSIQLP